VIMLREDTPSASGTLLGSDLITGFSVHEVEVKKRRITTTEELLKIDFIEQVFNNSLNIKNSVYLLIKYFCPEFYNFGHCIK
jgi:hypothetical protein